MKELIGVDFKELVSKEVVEASISWDDRPTGVFDSANASDIVDRIVYFHDKEVKHYKDQIDELADYIVKHHGEFIKGEGTCHTAVKIMKKLKWDDKNIIGKL